MKRMFILLGVLLILVLIAAVVSVTKPTQAEGMTQVFLPLVVRNFFTYRPGWNTEWQKNPSYDDPQDLLDDPATRETFADLPYGVLPDANQWHNLAGNSVDLPVKPEAFSYVATGHLKIDGILNLPYQEDNTYLVIFRGVADDAKFVELSGYAGGIYNVMPAGPYVTLGWIIQQIEAAGEAPNCTNGCPKATVVVVDLDTRTYRLWEVSSTSPRIWIRGIISSPEPTPVPTTEPTQEPPGAPSEYLLSWETDWHYHPGYPQNPQNRFSDQASWETFAEPGVLPDPDFWKILEGSELILDVEPGKFVYISTGEISIDGQALNFPFLEGNNYLIVLRGFDPERFSATRKVTLDGYAGGILNIIPSGGAVSANWFADQIVGSGTPPNCTEGCTQVTVVVIDLTTNTYRIWTIDLIDPDIWLRP